MCHARAVTKTRKWTTMRVSEETYQLAQRTLQKVSSNGWVSVASSRTDPPSLGAIIEEALRRLVKAS